jgi:hypothetical protein
LRAQTDPTVWSWQRTKKNDLRLSAQVGEAGFSYKRVAKDGKALGALGALIHSDSWVQQSNHQRLEPTPKRLASLANRGPESSTDALARRSVDSRCEQLHSFGWMDLIRWLSCRLAG